MNLSRLNPMPFLRAAARALRRLPVAKYLKPVWKTALKDLVVQEGGDALQAELVQHVRSKTPDAIAKASKLVDGVQERFKNLLHKVPFLPDAKEREILAAVNPAVDALQEQLRGCLALNGAEAAVAAMNRAFDRFQADLKGRVSQL